MATPRNSPALLRSALCAVLLLAVPMQWAAAEELGAPASTPASEEPWQKIETRPVALAYPPPVLSPGCFDRTVQHVVAFTAGAAPDLGLPRGAPGPGGKPLQPLPARCMKDFIWVDLDNNGKPGRDETKRVNPDGTTDLFMADLTYDNGVAAPYGFRLKTILENEKYAILGATARVAEFQGEKIEIFDDNGNGKFNDLEHDCIVVGGQPVTLLGKYIAIQDKFYEILVQASGTTLELRPAPKFDTGWIDAFQQFTPPQKAENLKIHTVIFTGAPGSFACDEKHRKVKVPVGAYDFAFAVFERARETVYMKKGEKTSFTVAKDQTAAPRWGGEVKATFTATSDGEEVTVAPPHFFGRGTEEYFPVDFHAAPVTARIAVTFKDIHNVELQASFGNKRYDLQPDGSLKPLVFKRRRNGNDDYEVTIEYVSGILGHVEGTQKLSFIYQKKGADKAAN